MLVFLPAASKAIDQIILTFLPIEKIKFLRL